MSKNAKISGKGVIIRADGTKQPFVLAGKTDLSEEELKKKLQSKEGNKK
jgi:hypothetical protein